MDFTQLINLIIKILGVAVGVLITSLYPKFKSWLDEKLSEQQQETLSNCIKTFVQAAEQGMKDSDPTGQKRKEYVENQLIELGITITEQVNAMIESQVLLTNAS